MGDGGVVWKARCESRSFGRGQKSMAFDQDKSRRQR
jgi:hypothetical protein